MGETYVAWAQDVLSPVRRGLVFNQFEGVVTDPQVCNFDLGAANAGDCFDDFGIPGVARYDLEAQNLGEERHRRIETANREARVIGRQQRRAHGSLHLEGTFVGGDGSSTLWDGRLGGHLARKPPSTASTWPVTS